MTDPADNSDPAEGPRPEPFYEHRVPPYPCPACAAGVLLLKRDTLHFGQWAESRALYDAVGPEIGEGWWRFACLFECCDADCRETVSCVGDMSWARDPRLPQEPGEPAIWRPGSGPFPDIGEQLRRQQAELVHEYQPLHFQPPLDLRARRTRDPVTVADDYSWIVVRGKRYSFRTGTHAKVIRVLHEAWQASGGRDGSGLSEKAIGEKVGSSADRFRLQKAFADNEALDRILRSPSKGQWALYLDGEHDPDSTAA